VGHGAQGRPYSAVALVSRFALASVFWRSGQTKVNGFSIREETFFLFREEYKVPLLPPDLAAYLATIGEHVFSVLLLIGLASRLSALGLFGMTMVIQLFVFPDGWLERILWVALQLLARSGRRFARPSDSDTPSGQLESEGCSIMRVSPSCSGDSAAKSAGSRGVASAAW
jgi:putative oxidoreductase